MRAGIVTGGASGIGEAIVRRLLRDGCVVYAVDRDSAALQRLEEKVDQGRLVRLQGDVTDLTFAQEVAGQVLAENGRLDFLVNVAGVVQPAVRLDDLSIEEFDRVIAVNLKGCFVFHKVAVQRMLRSGAKGAIVNISSMAGIRPVPRAGGYVASKHGVIGLTTTAALELADQGIRVNAICPGVIDTPLFRANAPGGPAEAMIGVIPMKRLGAADEIANATSWLISDEASYVTGAVLPVDGGMSLV